MAVVREDVVKLTFEYDEKSVSKANDAFDDLVAGVQDLSGSGGLKKAEDAFDDTQKAAEKLGKTDDAIDDLRSSVQKLGGSSGAGKAEDGLDNARLAAEKLGDTDTDVKGLTDEVQKLGGSNGTGKAEDGFDNARIAAKKFADTKMGNLLGELDKVADSVGRLALGFGKTLVKGMATAVTVGAAAVGTIGTLAIKGYAEYEQLVGGVETLFGAGGMGLEEYAKSTGQSVDQAYGEYVKLIKGQDMVKKNAQNAWQTSGLSANEYMSTVTSFSASMIQSLGGDTEKAAQMSDMAIRDMADNANKMGTDMESIMQTYQSIARGNYAMLDNLKLGYGGTKEEMKRLLADAKAITGIDYDINSFSDIVAAIHVIQNEMGITGTTAEEAAKTISGSAMAMKAAWQNFLVGLADENADFDLLLDNLVTSVKTFLNNLIPRIKKLAPRLIKGLTEIVGIIGKELPGLIAELAPVLIEGGISLVKSLVGAIADSAPMIKDAVLEIAKAIYKGFTGKEMSGEMFAELEARVDKVFDSIGKIISGVAKFGQELMHAIGPALIWVGDVLIDTFAWIGDNIDWLLPVLGSLLGALLAFRAVRKVSSAVSSFMGLFGKGGKGGLGELLGGGKGGKGGKGGLLSSFANLKPTTVLKGMGNLAIILGGLTILAAAFAAAAPHIAQLSDKESIFEVLAIVTALAVLGTGLTELAGIVGKIPVSTVAKGLANIAIVLGGFGVLGAAFAFVAPYISELATGQQMFELLAIISALGLVGSALAGLAGIVGMIPIPVVLAGLANIALVIAGFTAIVAAFGALAQIPGYTEFMQTGGDALVQLCGILGEMAGSLIGGLGEGISNSLPGIGQNLADFAANIKPMFDTFVGVDTAGLKEFAIALGALMLVLAGEELLSIITGGIDYAGLGTNLNTMMTNLGDFFTKVQEIPEDGFTKATALFTCLAGLAGLPKDGGVVSWFTGDVNYENIASGLGKLSSEEVLGFFDAVANIPETAFTQATALFDCLAGLKALPKEGGVVGWFAGEVDYEKIATGMGKLGSEEFIGAVTAIGELPETAFTNLTALFTALADMKGLPKEGGIFSWFTGEIDFSLLTTELPNLSDAIVRFYEDTAAIADFTKLTGLFDALQYIGKMTSAEGVDGWNVSVSNFTALAENLEAIADSMGYFITEVAALDLTQLGTFTSFLTVLGSETMVTSTASINESLTGMEEAMTKFSDAVTKFPESTATAFADAVTAVSTSMTDMDTAISTGTTAMNETLSTGLSNMSKELSLSFTAMIAMLNGYALNFYSSGVAIMQGLNRGMLSMKSTLLATASSIANSIASRINKALDINSPSGVTEDTGYWTGMGQVKGMLKSVPEVQAAADKISYASIPYGDTYSPESSPTTYNNNHSSVYTISPRFELNISGAEDESALAEKVKQWVAEGIDEVFDSLDRKLAY